MRGVRSGFWRRAGDVAMIAHGALAKTSLETRQAAMGVGSGAGVGRLFGRYRHVFRTARHGGALGGAEYRARQFQSGPDRLYAHLSQQSRARAQRLALAAATSNRGTGAAFRDLRTIRRA